MRFSTQALLAALASPLLALAQSNPFSVPNGGYNVTAGQTTTLTWTATTPGTVSLILRSGASSDLIAGTYIARNVTNSGTYNWNVDSSITRGSDYAVEIVDDTNNSNINFTPYLVIDSTNTVASSTSDIALGAATTTSVSSASASTSGAVLTGSTTNGGSSASSAISSANRSLSSAASSASSVVRSESSAASSSASAARTASSTSGGASSSAGAASTTAASTASGSGAAPTLMPAAGLVGLFALGAFAL